MNLKRYVETVVSPLVHIMEVLLLGLTTIAQAMKVEWTGKKAQEQSLSLLEYIKKKGRKKMITERTLKRWRKDALEIRDILDKYNNESEFTIQRREMSRRILHMTQELLDLHLIKK
jgi:hypothetical protein